MVSDSPPGDPSTHVHRVGRTARAGASGVAVTLVCTHGARETGLCTSSTSTSPSGAIDNDSDGMMFATDVNAIHNDNEMNINFMESALLPDTNEYNERKSKPPSTSSFSAQFSSSKELGRLNAIDSIGAAPIPRVEWLAPSSTNNARSSSSSNTVKEKNNPALRGQSNGGKQLLSKWASDWATIVVTGGRKDKLRPGDLLGALTAGAAGAAKAKKSRGSGKVSGTSNSAKKTAKDGASASGSKSSSNSGGGAGLDGSDVGKIEVCRIVYFPSTVTITNQAYVVAHTVDLNIDFERDCIHAMFFFAFFFSRSLSLSIKSFSPFLFEHS